MPDDLDLVLTPELAKAWLKSLRWKEDMVVVWHDGKRMWLGVARDKDGKRIGIWECCPEDDPCEHHKILEGAIFLETDQ